MESIFCASNEPSSPACRDNWRIPRHRCDSIYEKMGGTYTLSEDGFYYPDLELPEDEEARYGKYGSMRLKYLKEHRKGLYSTLLMEGRLNKHLNEIDDQAFEMLDVLMRQMKKQRGITEEMKSEDWLGWVGAVNNIQNVVDEIILNDIVFI